MCHDVWAVLGKVTEKNNSYLYLCCIFVLFYVGKEGKHYNWELMN